MTPSPRHSTDSALGTAPAPLEPGVRIGGYTIGRQLGAGASGSVYEATDDGGAQVALKLLHPHLDIEPDARLQMQHEVSVLQRLRDPNVAQVLDAELDASEAFIVTELIQGPTLATEVVTGGPLDELDLYELADQLAAALHKTHLAGVLHRDLKPSNVIVAEQGPVLIDFGVATDNPQVAPAGVTDATEPGLVVGTPGYLAPELLDGSPPTPTTDWWSWAALLAFAATGRPPFGSGARDDVLLRTRQGRADLVGLPPRTATALMGALAPDPAVRTSPAEVLQAIHRDGDPARLAAFPPSVGVADVPEAAVSDLPIFQTVVIPPVAAVESDDPTTPLEPVLLASVVSEGATDTRDAVAPTQEIIWDPTQRLQWADFREIPTAADATQVLPANTATTQVLSPRAAPTQVLPPISGGGVAVTPAGAGFALASAPAPAIPVAQIPSLPYPSVPTWYTRPVPPGRAGVLAALAALLVAVATGWPLIAWGSLAVLVIAVRVVGTAWADLADRRELAGVRRRSDAAIIAARTPWTLIKALMGALPQLLVGLATGVMVAAAAWWVVGRFDIPLPLITERAHQIALTLAGLATVLVTWFATNSQRTRLGARVALSKLTPGRVFTYIVIAVALIAATIIIVRVFTVPIPINWWPGTPPPAL